MTLLARFRDWWPGYTEADVVSLQEKWANGYDKPAGTLIHLTRGENRALCAGENVWGKTKRPSWTVTLTTVADVRRND